MADVWAQAPVETTIAFIKASTPQGGGEQEKGKYKPEEGLLKWGVKFGSNAHFSNLFTNDAPKEGDSVKVWEYWKEENGEKKFVKWFLDADYQRIKGGGRKPFGGGGGFKPNLTPEQEIMDKAIGHAVAAINNGVIAGDGTPMPANFLNLEKLTNWAYKKISEAGKKPEAQP